jgi:microcystin-dependent protein
VSGTIFGIGLSQRVKSTGKPENGWKLFLYTAGTSTPVTAYKDTGLSVGQEHPWPIVADASGTCPAFWLADGSYRVRGTSSNGGTIFFDIPSVLAIGASSGEGGADTTDPNAIFSTGMPIWMPISGVKTGWVRMNGRSIGSATSGATERANADCQTLFEYIWNNYGDTQCPVSSGRGASAAADWAANKNIGTLDMRGYGAFGLADMGNTDSGVFTGVTFAIGSATAYASKAGAARKTLIIAELPPHSHTPPAITDPGHTHTQFGHSGLGGVTGGGAAVDASANAANTGSSTTGISLGATGTTGSGQAFDQLSPAMLGTWYQKL